jgi:cell division protein FtsQ
MMKKIGFLLGHLAAIAGLFLAFGFIRQERDEQLCTRFDIEVDHSQGAYFIDKTELAAQLNKQGFAQLEGKPLASIDLTRMEKQVEQIPFVANAEAFVDIQGYIRLEVSQREPVLRIVNQAQESFYIDKNGLTMPTTTNAAAPVLVANGHIAVRMSQADTATNTLLRDLVLLNSYLANDELLQALFVQIYVNSKQEIELIPRVGNHSVLLGDISDLDEKFEKLLALYRQGFDEDAWRSYKLVNLKYKDQVICKK